MKKICVLFLSFLLYATLAGQDNSSFISQSQIPLAPVVSEISARIENSSVILSWNHSPKETLAYEIYRAENPITATTFASSTFIARVDSSTRQYSDSIESGKTYFYARTLFSDLVRL